MIIEGTANTPKVELDKNKRYILFEGESRPEDVRKFYEPILSWVNDELIKSIIDADNPKISVDFKMDYFNSASSKYILDLIENLKEISEKFPSSKVQINWHYDSLDDDMREAGKEFAMLTEFPFEFHEM